MKEKIKSGINDPQELENLYRSDKKAFRAAFGELFPGEGETDAIRFWNARLNYSVRTGETVTVNLSEILKLLAAGLLAVFLIHIPDIFSLNLPEFFYERNISFAVFTGLVLFTLMMNKERKPLNLVSAFLAFAIPAVWVNLLPSATDGGPVMLVLIHLPLLMWFVYGITFSGFSLKDLQKRIAFIRFNGDLVIVYGIIAIAGGILSVLTMGLFKAIGVDIGEMYAKYIIASGAVAAPVLASYLIGKFPSFVSRIAPVIALIFSPLVLLTLLVFLVTMAVTGKDPWNDREFLLIFNVMLLAVMAVIIFSVSETSLVRGRKFIAAVLFALSLAAVFTDIIALSAIFYRLGQFGITPNRMAVLVSNILVLGNLLLVSKELAGVCFRGKDTEGVEIRVAKYLPVYLVWIIFVVFGFPLVFGIS